MKTVLFIDNLEVFANHGLFEEENKLGQKFIFDIECELNYKKAMFSDEMTFTEFPQIDNIKLKINKPGAPIKYHFEKCGVEVKTSREEFYNL